MDTLDKLNIICDAQGQGGSTNVAESIVHLFYQTPESKSPALIKDQHEAEDEIERIRSQHRIRLKTVTFH
ncbi:hypothetical protein PSHT_09182 [Puccinia striiformis]|uniref:Uncharacterized protein n=1 Tax=Puccinia striiformis TaxID=27350 RepID=A0A2S4VIA1_9BASI|nr:hypothetical protein PSHT_09182 [Puccinia striiformis]